MSERTGLSRAQIPCHLDRYEPVFLAKKNFLAIIARRRQETNNELKRTTEISSD